MSNKAFKISLVLFILFAISYFFSPEQPFDTSFEASLKYNLERVLPSLISELLLIPFTMFFILLSILPGFPTGIIGFILWCTPSKGGFDVVYHCNNLLSGLLYFFFALIYSLIPVLFLWNRKPKY